MTRDDSWHKSMYERVLVGANTTGPAWDDLTEEQKAKIRAANNEHHEYMEKLGDAIRTGGPLPSPFMKLQ